MGRPVFPKALFQRRQTGIAVQDPLQRRLLKTAAPEDRVGKQYYQDEEIEEIQTFVRAFSYADGLAERYFEANPNLRFYRVAFELKDSGVEAYEMCVKENRLAYVPKEEDFWAYKRYFYEQRQLSKSRNFQYDEEDFFMKELGIAVRIVFLKALCGREGGDA